MDSMDYEGTGNNTTTTGNSVTFNKTITTTLGPKPSSVTTAPVRRGRRLVASSAINTKVVTSNNTYENDEYRQAEFTS